MNPYLALGFAPMATTGGAPQPAVDSSATVWTNPANPQPQSRLIALPEEIKSMILEDLLDADHPISARTQTPGQLPYIFDAAGRARDSRGRFVSASVRPPLAIGHGLTPAVLRTCQSLLATGRPQLYHRNVLQIDFAVGAFPGPILTQESICSASIQGCPKCAIVTTFDDEVLQQRDHQGAWHYDPNIQQIVSRFSKLLFTVRIADDNAAYDNTRNVVNWWARTPGFAQKEVQVDIVGPPAHWGQPHVDLLQIFRLMRCKKFSFVNGAALHPIHGKVELEVMSTLPVLNLDQATMAADVMLRTLFTELYRMNHQAGFARVQHCSTHLHQARKDFDSTKFQQVYAHVLGMHNELAREIQRRAQQSVDNFLAVETARAQELTRTGRTAQDYQ